jgi:hypothetical protein
MDKQTKKHIKYLNTVIDNLSNLLEYYECKLIEYRKTLAKAKTYPTGNTNNPVGVFWDIKEKEKEKEKANDDDCGKITLSAKTYPTGNTNNPVSVFWDIKEREKYTIKAKQYKTKQYKIFAVNPFEMFALLYQGKQLKGRISKEWNRLDDCFHQLDEPKNVSIKYKVYEYYAESGEALVGGYIEISKEESIYEQFYLRDKFPQSIEEIIKICISLELEYEYE